MDFTMNKYLLSFFLICSSANSAFSQSFVESHNQRQIEEATQGKSVEIDNLKPGELKTIEFMGNLIHIYRRTPSDFKWIKDGEATYMADQEDKNFHEAINSRYTSSTAEPWVRFALSGENMTKSKIYRSYSPEILVASAASPISGCMLNKKETTIQAGPNFIFHDPCTDTSYDPAGRVFRWAYKTPEGPALTKFNLTIPPHTVANNIVKIQMEKNLKKIPQPSISQDASPAEMLEYAASFNESELAAIALSRGAKANSTTKNGAPIINLALGGSDDSIIEFLIRNGARFDETSKILARLMGRNSLVK